LPLNRHLCHALICATLTTGLAVAHTDDSTQFSAVPSSSAADLPSSWLNQLLRLPFLRFLAPALEVPQADDPFASAPGSVAICSVQPLARVEDATALAFEPSLGSPGVVDTDGLTPTTARALVRFERIINSVGGVVAITSAYRPAPYQEHLQDVWDKWMLELRNNTDESCQSLKAEVADEFTRHQLLTTQRPVPVSDHTLGIGFDASVRLPARFARRKLSVDSLARKAGVLRPSIFHDPVHFRLIGSRG